MLTLRTFLVALAGLAGAASAQAKIDLRPNTVSAHVEGGGLSVDVQFSSLVGGDVPTESLAFDVGVFVNGELVHVEPVEQTLAGILPACYDSRTPLCGMACPGTVHCVFVDLVGTLLDYCACDWIGDLVSLPVPGVAGDDVSVVLDLGNVVLEEAEANNTLSTTATASVPTAPRAALVGLAVALVLGGALVVRARRQTG